eukprot:Colp12_sorted_trinity150504_noHs@32797
MEGATEPKKRGRSASFAKWVQSPLLKEKYNGLKNSGSHEDFTVLQNEGKVFIVKYIGETICDAWTGQDAADRAARQILLRHSTKSKLPKLELTINIDGLKVYSPEAKATLFSYPLHKISQFCSTHDKYEGKEVCSYIASRQGEEKALPVLHLFFCKQPHELSRATDQSFALAYKRHVDQKGLQPKGFALDPSSAPAEEGGPAATDFPVRRASAVGASPDAAGGAARRISLDASGAYVTPQPQQQQPQGLAAPPVRARSASTSRATGAGGFSPQAAAIPEHEDLLIKMDDDDVLDPLKQRPTSGAFPPTAQFPTTFSQPQAQAQPAAFPTPFGQPQAQPQAQGFPTQFAPQSNPFPTTFAPQQQAYQTFPGQQQYNPFPQQFAPQQQIQTTQYSSPQPQPAYHQGQGQRRPSQLGQQNPFAQPQTSPFADDFAQLSLRNQ